jgi:hypothetical protein
VLYCCASYTRTQLLSLYDYCLLNDDSRILVSLLSNEIEMKWSGAGEFLMYYHDILQEGLWEILKRIFQDRPPLPGRYLKPGPPGYRTGAPNSKPGICVTISLETITHFEEPSACYLCSLCNFFCLVAAFRTKCVNLSFQFFLVLTHSVR